MRAMSVGVLKTSDDVEKFAPMMALRAALGTAGKKIGQNVGVAGKKLMGNIKATPQFLANQANPLQSNNNSPMNSAFDALSRTADSNKAANQQMMAETRNLARTGAGTSGTGTQGA